MQVIKSLVLRILGLGMLIFGIGLSVWIAYNLFVHTTPEFAKADGGTRSAPKGMIFGLVLAAFGWGLFIGGGKKPRNEMAERYLAPQPGDDLDHETLSEIQTLALNGRRIEAIKLFRERTGADLTAAKQAVEELEHQFV